jgi:sugar-specific transcriptional regulator TrmB
MQSDNQEQAAGLLQQLGLKEYEAKCFVALSRMEKATAKDISEITDVPRTRVYDAIRVLEAQGLVEIQHTNPRQYRAVPLSEATETLRQQYESRVDELEESRRDIEPAEASDDDEPVHEVWSLSGAQGISSRTLQLLDEAEEEAIVVITADETLRDALIDRLNQTVKRGINVIVGTVSEDLEKQLQDRVPRAKSFVSELGWLHEESDGPADVSIGRMMLVDRNTILISSLDERKGTERAVFGRGFENGLVVIVRRLMATGLLPVHGPGK